MTTPTPEAAPCPIEAIGEQIRTQDNLATELPIFYVQSRRRIYGLQTDWSDEQVYLYDGDEITEWEPNENERVSLRSLDEKGELPDAVSKCGYTDIWITATACFTRKGCEDYLAVNGHNLTDPRIYVGSRAEAGHRAGRAVFSIKKATRRPRTGRERSAQTHQTAQ